MFFVLKEFYRYENHVRELLRVRLVSPNTFLRRWSLQRLHVSSPRGKPWAVFDSYHLVSKEKWNFQFNAQYFITSVRFLSLGRAIFKKLRQRTHSNNSSKSQLRGQQPKTNTHVCYCMDWGIVGCHSANYKREVRMLKRPSFINSKRENILVEV